MEYLASVIVDSFSLFKQLLMALVNGGNSIDAQDKALMGDSISDLFANWAHFFSALTAEIIKHMSNTAS